MFILGIILISTQDKVKIDFDNKTITKYFSVMKVPIPFIRTTTDLNKFNKAYLYQISEKGTIQTKAQSFEYKNLEYWKKVKLNI